MSSCFMTCLHLNNLFKQPLNTAELPGLESTLTRGSSLRVPRSRPRFPSFTSLFSAEVSGIDHRIKRKVSMEAAPTNPVFRLNEPVPTETRRPRERGGAS